MKQLTKAIKVAFLARAGDKIVLRKGKAYTKPVTIAFLELK